MSFVPTSQLGIGMVDGMMHFELISAAGNPNVIAITVLALAVLGAAFVLYKLAKLIYSLVSTSSNSAEKEDNKLSGSKLPSSLEGGKSSATGNNANNVGSNGGGSSNSELPSDPSGSVGDNISSIGREGRNSSTSETSQIVPNDQSINQGSIGKTAFVDSTLGGTTVITSRTQRKTDSETDAENDPAQRKLNLDGSGECNNSMPSIVNMSALDGEKGADSKEHDSSMPSIVNMSTFGNETGDGQVSKAGNQQSDSSVDVVNMSDIVREGD